MIRKVFIILFIASIATLVVAEESELAVNTSEGEEQKQINITNEGNVSPNSTISNGSSIGNRTASYTVNQTSEINTSVSADDPRNAEKKEGKSVYTLSIGSVYSSDYTEPQPRTFTSSGC